MTSVLLGPRCESCPRRRLKLVHLLLTPRVLRRRRHRHLRHRYASLRDSCDPRGRRFSDPVSHPEKIIVALISLKEILL